MWGLNILPLVPGSEKTQTKAQHQVRRHREFQLQLGHAIDGKEQNGSL